MRWNLIYAGLLLGMAVGMSSLLHLYSTSAAPQSEATRATLVNTCLITKDVAGLTGFYAQVLQLEPHKEGSNYVEFRSGVGVLALFAAEAQENYIPGSAIPGENHSVILEFKVTDVDQEYARLQKFVKSWVKGPTNQPWGTRSIYFRDPDGNLVDFFTWRTPRKE